MFNVKKDDCIKSNKCIYVLVQAAWQYYKKAVKILKSRFVRGSIDPCLYVRKSMKVIVDIALCTDNLMMGGIATIDDAIEALKNKRLELKIM